MSEPSGQLAPQPVGSIGEAKPKGWVERLVEPLTPSQDPYLREAQNVFDAERQRRVRAEWAVLFLAALTFVLAGGVVMAWSSRSVEFVYVPVDELGAAAAPVAPAEAVEPTGAMTRHLLREYVRASRSYSNDSVVQAEWWEKATAYAAGEEARRLDALVLDASRDKKKRRRESLISVSIEKVLPLSETGDRWEVVWTELERRAGTLAALSDRTWRGILVTESYVPKTRLELERNPYGTRVKEFLAEELHEQQRSYVQ